MSYPINLEHDVIKLYARDPARVIQRVAAIVDRAPSDVFRADSSIDEVIAGIERIQRENPELDERELESKLMLYFSGLDSFTKTFVLEKFREIAGITAIDAIGTEALSHQNVISAVSNSVKLIKILTEEQKAGVTNIVLEGIRKGDSRKTIAKAIQDFAKVTQSKAEFWAIDQFGNAWADMNKTRQTGLGFARYIWRTSEDERVRPEHADQNGKTFRWDTGAFIESRGLYLHPGQDYRCRCTPEPVR